MPEFLESFDVERARLLAALEHVETVWSRFQERRGIDLEGADASDSLIAAELADVRASLQSTTFTIGLFGLIKRGKSTLLNSLIGREVSAMHVTPETAVPVYVGHGEQPGAAVHLADGTIKHVAVEEVATYTSQKYNPGNRLGVTHVEQTVPVGFLRNGTRLIDTPGLDDAEADEVYTERTMQELDVVDAGVVVFLSPPTVGSTEMAFLESIVARDLRKTFLVCNMYPQHFHDPATRRDVLNYVGTRIVEAGRRSGMKGQIRLYPVCALDAWNARSADDIDLWKRSGADRLLRDLELYLTGTAGSDVLRSAAERIATVADMATAEVRVRQQLLGDPERLSTYRAKVDEDIRDLERQFDGAVALALTDVGPLKMRIRGLMLQPFSRAKRTIDQCQTVHEVEEFANRFRREVEVAGELASRQFHDGLERLAATLQRTLEDRFQAVITDLAPNIPELRTGGPNLGITPDQLAALQRAEERSRQSGRTGAFAGGLAGGGAALVAAGGLLGPIGLLAGALVGWKLSSLVAGQRNLAKAKETVAGRLDEIAARLVADFDEQVRDAVLLLRGAVQRRRKAFAGDLYQQFDLVQRISQDPSLLEAHRRDAERFAGAFGACADRARRAVAGVAEAA